MYCLIIQKWKKQKKKKIKTVRNENLLKCFTGTYHSETIVKVLASVCPSLLHFFLNPYQTTNFRHFQIERVCRRQFQILNTSILKTISPFPPVFSTRLTNFLAFSSNLKFSSATCLSLEEFKICCLGKNQNCVLV